MKVAARRPFPCLSNCLLVSDAGLESLLVHPRLGLFSRRIRTNTSPSLSSLGRTSSACGPCRQSLLR
jgi:hypothetical protein